MAVRRDFPRCGPLTEPGAKFLTTADSAGEEASVTRQQLLKQAAWKVQSSLI